MASSSICAIEAETPQRRILHRREAAAGAFLHGRGMSQAGSNTPLRSDRTAVGTVAMRNWPTLSPRCVTRDCLMMVCA